MEILGTCALFHVLHLEEWRASFWLKDCAILSPKNISKTGYVLKLAGITWEITHDNFFCILTFSKKPYVILLLSELFQGPSNPLGWPWRHEIGLMGIE